MELFNGVSKEILEKKAPLADRMRPRNLEEFVGQEHLLAQGKVLRKIIESDEIPSMILWGPPGSGKTTLAKIIAATTGSYFISFSAVLSGVKEIREVVKEAQEQLKYHGRRTILFVDEIHRFNKAQQDAFLPHVEKGTITLIGATTENPSFEVISPLLSRSRVFVLNPLAEEQLIFIMKRAIEDSERGLGMIKIHTNDEILRMIASFSDGDVRIALNTLEIAVSTTPYDNTGCKIISQETALEAMQKKTLLYDKKGEEHYNLISALHKSLRGSDPDAAIYWLGRMLDAGEDPLYIARRMIRFASEDIGNADPQALQVAIAAMNSYHFLGTPEGELALAQCAVYLATAPKSNAIYIAYNEVQKDIKELPAQSPPLHIRNAPTKLMKELGYAREYKYAHDYKDAYVEQEYLPENLRGRIYYNPTDRGFELEIKKRLQNWRKNKKGNKG